MSATLPIPAAAPASPDVPTLPTYRLSVRELLP
jgi:hypothetical protein